MSQPGRDRIRGALGPLWGLALILGWVAPHDHGVVLVCRIGLAVVLVALGGAFIVGWIRARRAGDPTAELHPRAVLALGALLAFGAAGAAEAISGSTSAATWTFLALVTLALLAYVLVARRTASRTERPAR